MSKSIQSILAGAMLALPLGLIAEPVVFVDDDWAGESPGANVTTSSPAPPQIAVIGTNAFASIADAVDAVDPGGIVWVAAGQYAEGGPIVIDKSLELRGANYNSSPNNIDGSASARGPESVILAHEHDDSWSTSGVLIDVFDDSDSTVVIDGFTLEGFNPAIASGSEPIGPNGSDPVGSNTGISSDAGELTLSNNIMRNISQFPVNLLGGGNTIENNRILNMGVPNVLGYGVGVLASGGSTYVAARGNYLEYTRAGFQMQSMNTARPDRESVVEDNWVHNVESMGIFLNMFGGSSNDYSIRNNIISGLGPDRGTGGVAIVSSNDGATERRHTISHNTISDIVTGYFFANNDMDRQVVTGGTVSNVSYGLSSTNRLGYRGIVDYQSSGSETDAATGRDGIGGWAVFSSESAIAAIPESGLTGEIALPDPGDDATGQTAFANSDFDGKIALLTAGGDASIAASNALAAGAIAVIIANTNNTPPPRLLANGTFENVDIAVTTIDLADADVIRNDINTNGNTVVATLYPWDFPSNSYGVNAPAVLNRSSKGVLVNVRIDGAVVAGFGLIDIPNELGTGNVPAPVLGRVIGGSRINGSPYGALVVGENAELTAQSVYFENNEVALRVDDGSLDVSQVNIISSNQAGVRVTGETSNLSITNSNFDNQSLAIEVSDNPDGVSVTSTNFFDTSGTAVANLTPGNGTVSALGNYWGDPSGPNDAAGDINGSGAAITLGVDASDFLPAAIIVADTGYFVDTLDNGLFDWLEVLLGYDPLDPDDPNRAADFAELEPSDWDDNDGDLLPNWVEAVFGTDPDDPDTDGDGIRDDYELFRGTDPTNPNSYPPFGDANFDGTVDLSDALDIFRLFLGLVDPADINPSEADMNLDGTINNIDGTILINYILGNIEVIPVTPPAP